MTCPKCESTRLGVKDIVHNDESNETYRQRKCLECGKIFYTVEFEAVYDDQFADDWNRHHRSSKKK